MSASDPSHLPDSCEKARRLVTSRSRGPESPTYLEASPGTPIRPDRSASLSATAPTDTEFPILPSHPSAGEDAATDYLDPETSGPFPKMSTYSSSSQDDALYSFPDPKNQILAISGALSNPRSTRDVSPGFIYQDREQLIHSLRTHRVNTITELRRIEKIFAHFDSAEVTEPMTSAWVHYVNSNNLLSELRCLTKSYPFSSECLDEAKWMVVGDPQSSRSWNYCWLVLNKIQEKQLIPKHAREIAAKPAMWGGKLPTPSNVEQLANACIVEWTRALRQMLRHWDTPPTTTGH